MSTRYTLGRALQGMGLAAVLVGLMMSVSLGLNEQGLESMKYELYGLIGGVVVFYLGKALQGKGEA